MLNKNKNDSKEVKNKKDQNNKQKRIKDAIFSVQSNLNLNISQRNFFVSPKIKLGQR